MAGNWLVVLKKKEAKWGWELYEAFILCQEDGDAGVDFSDCERDEHCCGGKDGVWKLCRGYECFEIRGSSVRLR